MKCLGVLGFIDPAKLSPCCVFQEVQRTPNICRNTTTLKTQGAEHRNINEIMNLV
jgi:hypothetical protein